MPIVTFDSIDDVISLVNNRSKPLSLYVFSKNRSAIDKILNHTSSGGVCINDTVIHFSQTNLPFGGVGGSGMGKSHGFHGFKEFSNEKAVVKHHRYSPLKLMYPPLYKAGTKNSGFSA